MKKSGRKKVAKRSVTEIAEYLLATPLVKWKTIDFMNYYLLLKTTYDNIYFCPTYVPLQLRFVKLFVERYGARDAKDILDGLFIFRKELKLSSFALSALCAHGFGPFRERALALMRKHREESERPLCLRKPRHDWTTEDYDQFKIYCQKQSEGKEINHGQTQESSN